MFIIINADRVLAALLLPPVAAPPSASAAGKGLPLLAAGCNLPSLRVNCTGRGDPSQAGKCSRSGEAWDPHRLAVRCPV